MRMSLRLQVDQQVIAHRDVSRNGIPDLLARAVLEPQLVLVGQRHPGAGGEADRRRGRSAWVRPQDLAEGLYGLHRRFAPGATVIPIARCDHIVVDPSARFSIHGASVSPGRWIDPMPARAPISFLGAPCRRLRENAPMGREGTSKDEDPLLRLAVRRTARRVRDEAATPEFARLLSMQALGAAGDALVALALAGSLFFSVPETTARGRVLLYLLLTMAPFAIAAPLLSRALDRSAASLRGALVLAAAGRALAAWLLASRLDSLLLFPLAFAILVLSRAALIARGALLPAIAPEGRSLVRANSSLSKASAIAGIIAVPLGLVILNFFDAPTELVVAAVVYVLGVVPAARLPAPQRKRALVERVEARAAARTMTVRQAVLATGGMRFLVGFLVFHLAFALRREDLAAVGLGLLVASAAVGSLAGAFVAPRLRRRLKEEGIIVLSLVAGGLAGVLTGARFSVVSAAVLVGVFGVAAGAAKVSFDSILQRDISEGARGWAFARFEAVLQFAWVLGATIPVVLTIPGAAGVVAVGILANFIGLVYVVGRLRARTVALP